MCFYFPTFVVARDLYWGSLDHYCGTPSLEAHFAALTLQMLYSFALALTAVRFRSIDASVRIGLNILVLFVCTLVF